MTWLTVAVKEVDFKQASCSQRYTGVHPPDTITQNGKWQKTRISITIWIYTHGNI